MTMTAKQVGRVVVFDDELILFGLAEEGFHAVIDVRAGEPVHVLGQVRERFIEPAFLLDRNTRRARSRDVISG